MEVDDSEEWPDDNNSDWVLMELADDELELLEGEGSFKRSNANSRLENRSSPWQPSSISVNIR